MSMFVKWPPPNAIQAVSDLEARGRDGWRRRKSARWWRPAPRVANEKCAPQDPRRFEFNLRFCHFVSSGLVYGPMGASNAHLCLSPQDVERILRPRQNRTRNPKDGDCCAERVKDARGWEGSKEYLDSNSYTETRARARCV
jgi:hypothetical protein